jgi:hypothetical protein
MFTDPRIHLLTLGNFVTFAFELHLLPLRLEFPWDRDWGWGGTIE